jgi:hypothetical protein
MGNAGLLAWAPGHAEKWQLAFAQLLEAAYYARNSGQAAMQFAVAVTTLYGAGLSTNDLRWLWTKAYIKHAVEITRSGRHRRRRFRPCQSARFSARTCFVLTQAGIAFGQSCCRRRISRRKDQPGRSAAIKPRWDRAGRTLWLGADLVKRFIVPAGNQELILAAFQEEGWPSGIDDPLPRRGRTDPKRRVHDAIFKLNRCQTRPLIRFAGNGNGLGIRWERVTRSGPKRARSKPARR